MDGDFDKVFKALADPGRRLLLDRLFEDNGQTLGQLCERMEMTRQAVTKHLKLLERAGLIERKKQGREVFISFRGEPLRQVAEWVHEYERFWNERLDEFQQYFKDKKQKKEKKS